MSFLAKDTSRYEQINLHESLVLRYIELHVIGFVKSTKSAQYSMLERDTTIREFQENHENISRDYILSSIFKQIMNFPISNKYTWVSCARQEQQVCTQTCHELNARCTRFAHAGSVCLPAYARVQGYRCKVRDEEPTKNSWTGSSVQRCFALYISGCLAQREGRKRGKKNQALRRDLRCVQPLSCKLRRSRGRLWRDRRGCYGSSYARARGNGIMEGSAVERR